MNIKVLHVVRGLPNSSGTSHIVKPLAEEQARQGADVSVWSCAMPNEVPVEIDPNLVRTRMFPISLPLYHPGVSWPFARAIWKNVVEYDFVHIHAVFNFPTLMTMAAATRRKVPFAVAPQGSFEPWALAWHGRRKAIYAKCLELPLMQRAAFLQALTLTEESQMRNLGLRGKVKILPNGLNLSESLNVEAQSTLVLSDGPVVISSLDGTGRSQIAGTVQSLLRCTRWSKPEMKRAWVV